MQSCIDRFGKPKQIITDGGTQFKDQFKAFLRQKFIIHRKPKRRKHPKFNGKIERFFRTFKTYLRIKFLKPDVPFLQIIADQFIEHYNEHRIHQAHDQTPDELWHGIQPKQRLRFLSRAPVKPKITITRQCINGDAHLSFPEFEVRTYMAAWPTGQDRQFQFSKI